MDNIHTYDSAFGPLVNSMWTYAPRTRRTLLLSPINTLLHPLHFMPILPLNTVSYECFWKRIRDFLEVMLQGGNLLSLACFLSCYAA